MWINCGKLWIDVNYEKFKINKRLVWLKQVIQEPLIKKLGIKPGMKILVIHSTENYSQLLDVSITGQYVAQNQIQDIIHLFAETETVFKKGMKTVLSLCKTNYQHGCLGILV